MASYFIQRVDWFHCCTVQPESTEAMCMMLKCTYTFHDVTEQKTEKCWASINSQQRDSSWGKSSSSSPEESLILLCIFSICVSFSVAKLAFIELVGCHWMKFMTLRKIWNQQYVYSCNNVVWFSSLFKSVHCSMEKWMGLFEMVQWREMISALTLTFLCHRLSLQAAKVHTIKGNNEEPLIPVPGIEDASESRTKKSHRKSAHSGSRMIKLLHVRNRIQRNCIIYCYF